MATANSTSPNIEAISILVSEINNLAVSLKRLCCEAVPTDSGDIERSSALIIAAVNMASVIGWQSEKCAELLGERNRTGGDADYWIFPPCFHSANKTSEARHD